MSKKYMRIGVLLIGILLINSVSASTTITDQNITTTGDAQISTGFFTWLGNVIDRITKLFVHDVDINGQMNMTGTLEMNVNSSITANHTTNKIWWDELGNLNIQLS